MYTMDTQVSTQQDRAFKYLEEINDAVLRQFPLHTHPQKMKVLDVGCGTAVLAEAIEKKGYSVWGIEVNTQAVRLARPRISRVIHADLHDIDMITQEIGGEVFDYLIFADILEHLRDPALVLKQYLKFLKPSGYVVLSLPNAVVWTNRIMFFIGRFEYSETGIMDEDHIRFFTFRSAKRLLREAGCSVVRTDYIPYFIRMLHRHIKPFLLKGKEIEATDRRQLIDSKYYQWYMRYIYPIEYCLGYVRQSLFAFKMVVVGRKNE